MDIETINASCGNHIAQLFQGGTDERGSTVPVVDKLMLRGEDEAECLHLSTQFTQLTFNGLGLALLL